MVSNTLRRLALSTLHLRARLKKEPPVINPFDPEFRRNPYPLYRELRERDPVHFHPLGVWVVTRHADAETVWTDPRFHHPPYEDGVIRDGKENPAEWMRSKFFISQNPPGHTRLREIVSPLFVTRSLDAIRGRVQDITDKLLDRFEPAGGMDVVQDFAGPLPLTVIAELMGLPMDDLAQLHDWSQGALGIIDAFPRPELRARGEAAAQSFRDYFTSKLSERRSRPGEDWISRLLAAQQAHPDFTDDDIVASSVLLFMAGHETTVMLISVGLLALLRNPDQLARLRADPARMPGAVEECLRFEPPVQFIGRMASEDVRLGGKLIRKGQTVFMAVSAVNRDPEKFPDPDRFDITRPPPARHMAFGRGIHSCMGQYLARMEGTIAFSALLRRFPKIRQAGEPAYLGRTIDGRGLSSLPVRFD